MGPDQILVRMIDAFVRQRAEAELTAEEVDDFCQYCQHLIEERQVSPKRGSRYDWNAIAHIAGILPSRLKAAGARLSYGLDALAREIPKLPEKDQPLG